MMSSYSQWENQNFIVTETLNIIIKIKLLLKIKSYT